MECIYTNSCGYWGPKCTSCITAVEEPQLWGIEDVFSVLGSVLCVWWFWYFAFQDCIRHTHSRIKCIDFFVEFWIDFSDVFCHFHPLEYWSCLFLFHMFYVYRLPMYVLAGHTDCMWLGHVDVCGKNRCKRTIYSIIFHVYIYIYALSTTKYMYI